MKKTVYLSLAVAVLTLSAVSCKKCGECVSKVTGISSEEVCFDNKDDYDAAKAACNNSLGLTEWRDK